MSTSALSQYFPFLDRQNDEPNEAIASTFAVASVGITMLKMLETLLPAAANEVERESRLMVDHFTTLADYITAQGEVPASISEAMTGIIVGMQFQDRNTQVMENVAGMIERYRTMLEEVCGNIDAMRDAPSTSGHTIAQAVEDILSSIRLSDIRARYLEALAKAKAHGAAEILPMPIIDASEDIELF